MTRGTGVLEGFYLDSVGSVNLMLKSYALRGSSAWRWWQTEVPSDDLPVLLPGAVRPLPQEKHGRWIPSGRSSWSCEPHRSGHLFFRICSDIVDREIGPTEFIFLLEPEAEDLDDDCVD